MQVNFSPKIMSNFKGSFKIQDLDAFIDDFEETPADFKARKKRYIKEYKRIQSEPKTPKSLVIKKTGLHDNESGYITAVVMSPCIQGTAKKTLQPFYAQLCNNHDVDPDYDLFMVSGLDPLERRYVMFNSFFKDEKDEKDYVQVFYTSSEDNNLTKIQKDIIKIFNDIRNKKYLCQGSTNNPFQKACDNGVFLDSVFAPAISELECISQEMPESDIFDSKGKVPPVIYTQKPYGDYIRYKVFVLYK